MKKIMATLIVFITLVSAILSWPLIKDSYAQTLCYIQSEYLGALGGKVCVYNCPDEQLEIVISSRKQCPMRIDPTRISSF